MRGSATEPLKFGFNTQPPEGGWLVFWISAYIVLFQHTAA